MEFIDIMLTGKRNARDNHKLHQNLSICLPGTCMLANIHVNVLTAVTIFFSLLVIYRKF